MEFIDEQIVEAMNDYKKGQHGTIDHGIFIHEELFEFEKQEFFDGKMSIMLPKKFIDMPEELAKLKYPSIYRPEIIKMNETSDVNIMLSYTDTELEKNMVEKITGQICEGLKKAQPANVYYGKKVIAEGDKVIGWFDFKSHSIDEKIYNLMSFCSIHGKMLHLTFCCKYTDYELWKPVALQIINTIEEI